MNSFTYRIYNSISVVLMAARSLERTGLQCKVVPIPRMYSSNCGVCLRTDTLIDERVQRTLTESGISASAVHRLEK